MNNSPPQSTNPRISIIVPVQNMEATIERTLESVLRQREVESEVIVIDGQSTDDTMKIVEQYGDSINQVISEQDNGYYDAVNKGIARARGDIIGILNGDDYYVDDAVLSLYVERFDSSDADLVFADLEFFRPNDPSRTIRHYSSKNFTPRKLRFGWMPPHPTVFVRKSVYDIVGTYSTNFRISADYEFLIRALVKHRIPYERISRVAVRMHYGGISTSGLRASFRLNREILRACKANGLRSSWFLILLKIPAKLMEFLPRR